MSKRDSKYLVFGFIAEIESKLLSNNIIPKVLKELCFKYYFICEHFAYHGECIVLNEARDTAWNPNGMNRASHTNLYGNQIVDPSNKLIKSYKWTLKILGFESMRRYGFFMGLDASHKKYLNGHFMRWQRNTKPIYAFPVTKYKLRHGQPFIIEQKLKYQVGDIVCLELNVENKSFGIVVNNDPKNSSIRQNIKVKNVKYRLAITLSHASHKIQLIKFETENY